MLCSAEPEAVNFALTQKEDSGNTLVMTVSFVLCVPTKVCSLRCAMSCRARDCELCPDTDGRFGQHPGNGSKFYFMYFYQGVITMMCYVLQSQRL